MKPKNVKRNINLAFKRYFRCFRSNNKDISPFVTALPYLNKRIEYRIIMDECVEPCMYQDILDEDNIEYIISTLSRIHDRWDCQGRLLFIKTLVEKYGNLLS